MFIIQKSTKNVVRLLNESHTPFYTTCPTMIQKWLSLVHMYPYHHCILSFQKFKNNGNIYMYHKARDRVVVLAMLKSCFVSVFAFVPLMKLMFGDFLSAFQSVPKLDQAQLVIESLFLWSLDMTSRNCSHSSSCGLQLGFPTKAFVVAQVVYPILVAYHIPKEWLTTLQDRLRLAFQH